MGGGGRVRAQLTQAEVEPFAIPAVERLVPILVAPHGQMPRSLQENSAITIGRIAWMCPEPIAPHLAHFVGPWCQALRQIRDDIEKEHAFLGLAACIRLNAEVLRRQPPSAVLSYPTPLDSRLRRFRIPRNPKTLNPGASPGRTVSRPKRSPP